MFSIIIPLYNKGSQIKKSIDSVLSQDCQDFEIVVIDDGSTDGSSSFVHQYNDKRIRYFYKENGGVSSARNYGINKAEGEWIIFLDADDEMLPGTLSSFKKVFVSHKDAYFIVAKQDNNYESHGLIQRFILRRGNIHKTTHPYLDLWLRLFFPCPGTVCISKSHIVNRKGFDEKLSFFEDMEWMIRLMKDSIVFYIPHLALRYNQADTGLSKSAHSVECEMTYYIPDSIESATFWHRALLYDYLNFEIFWWQQHGNEANVKLYQDMQKQYFSWIFKALHWVRQKMIRKGVI